MPHLPVERWLSPVRRFLHIESASGIVLLTCTVLALVLANSSLADEYAAIWKTSVEFSIGSFQLTGDLGHLVINDGLMTIFFFVVGLEIKREIVTGELRELRKALLPIFAAAGGMVAPALIYYAIQAGEPGQRGWAIPMATDIAFVVGVLALFGPRVPFGLKILLLSLAIVDDLGAVLVIAFFFTDALAWEWIGAAAGGLALIFLLNRIGVRRITVYVMVGVIIWVCLDKSGIHATVAGVLLGLLTPAGSLVGDKKFFAVVGELWERLRRSEPGNGQRRADLDQLKFAAREAVSPLTRLETALHPWVAFVIMPLFALANAGVPLEMSGIDNPVAGSVAMGLALGKPLGIVLFSWLAVQLGLTRLPAGVGWPLMIGGACLAGIGFTMALFINGLAFPPAKYPEMESAGKLGTLMGSLISAIVGAGILLIVIHRALSARRREEK